MTTLPQIIGELDKIRLDERDTVRQANSTVALEDVRRSIFGKKGRLSILLRAMGGLSAVDRPQAGKAANEIKEELQVAIDERARELQAREMEQSVEAEHLDISLPGIRPRLGTLHPLTRILREIEDAFISMGFTVEL
ncbi:phenylalanine--tRNA ligase subunit alpha, partial [bacterium]|nr:phenylalanine--tRNA ligase subunit alpha [bacterium]